MKKWITVCLVALLSFSSFGMIFGKEGTRLIGKTSQISQESKTFVLKTENETWKVVWDDKTNFIADGKKATPDDLKDDVEVMVAGKPVGEEKTINAVLVAWGKIPEGKGPGEDQPIPNIFGVMSEMNLTEKTFKLEAKDRQGGSVIFTVTYQERTAFIRDKKQAKPEDFKDGEEVTVAGKVNIDEKTIVAMAIALGRVKLPPGEGNDRPPMVFGKMTTISLTDKSFHLELKDREGNAVVFVVTYTDDTTFIRDKEQAKPEDFKDGEEVTVAGRVNRVDKTILALAVVLGKVEPPPEDPGDRGPDSPPGAPYKAKGVKGIVTEINLDKNQFTMETKKQVLITIQFHDWTDFVKNGLFVMPSHLQKEDKVTVYGPIDAENKTIDAHYVVW